MLYSESKCAGMSLLFCLMTHRTLERLSLLSDMVLGAYMSLNRVTFSRKLNNSAKRMPLLKGSLQMSLWSYSFDR